MRSGPLEARQDDGQHRPRHESNHRCAIQPGNISAPGPTPGRDEEAQLQLNSTGSTDLPTDDRFLGILRSVARPVDRH